MKTYIALFRGINIVGHHSLPMQQLKSIMENIGYRHVTTYIQSGNVVFQTPDTASVKLAEKISKAIEKAQGFKPEILLLEKKDLQKAINANPFPQAEPEPKTLHVLFLASTPTSPDLDKMHAISTATERFKLTDRLFYLHAPDGVGRSKLAANAEKLLRVPATGRNWRTVCKLLEMVEDE